MGCGPSKNANVAIDNTVKSKSLPKNNPNESNNTTSSLSSTTTTAATNVRADTNTVTEKAEAVPTVDDTKAAAAKEEEEAKGNEDVQVKDVLAPSIPTVPEEEEEGKFVNAGSPDRYFSSRKDEEAAPVPEIVGGETVEIVSAAAANAKEVEAEEVALDGSCGGQGKTSSMDSADFKEAIFEEEEEAAELMEMEEKNASMAS